MQTSPQQQNVNVPQQTPSYTPPPPTSPQYHPPSTYGPPVGERLGGSFAAKIGLVVLIISIVGLILSAVVPWYVISASNGTSVTGWYNFAGDKVGGDKEAGDSIPQFIPLYISQRGVDILADRGWLSITGFVLGIVFSSLLFAFGLVRLGRLQKIINTLNITFGGLLLLSGTICAYSGSSGIGLMILWAHAAPKGVSFISVAPFIVLILGFIMIFIAIGYIKREMKGIMPTHPTAQMGGGY